MKRSLHILAPLLVVLMVGACLDYSEEYTLDDQGKGSVVIRLAVHRVEEFSQYETACAEFLPVDESSARKFFKNPAVKYVPGSFKKQERGKVIIMTAQYRFNRVTDCNEGNRRQWTIKQDDKGNTLFTFSSTIFSGVNVHQELRRAARTQRRLFGTRRFAIKAKFTRPIEYSNGVVAGPDSIKFEQTVYGILMVENPMFTFSAAVRGLPRTSGPAFKAIYGIIVVIMIISGFSSRLFGSVLNFFNLLFAALITINFFEPLASLSTRYIPYGAEYHHAVVFIVLFTGLILLGQELLIGRGKEWIDINRVADMAGSAIFGLISGFIVAGVIALFYFLLPWQEDVIQGKLDTAHPPVLLRVYRGIANKVPGSNKFDPVGEFPMGIKRRK